MVAVDIRYAEPELNGGVKTQCLGSKEGHDWTSDLVRLFNDEQAVRAAAQAALDRALATGAWAQVAERRFDMPAHFADFAAFERRMLDVTFAERHLDSELRERVRARFESHVGIGGAHFERPMHVRLLRKPG